MKYFIMFCALFFCVNTSSGKPGFRGVIAEPLDFNGDVRLKRSDGLIWHELKKDSKLLKGDLLFIGNYASLKLRYVKEQASITLPPNSIFEVEETLPTATRQKRAFANSKYEGALRPRMQDDSGNFTRTIAAPSTENADAENSFSSGIVIDRIIRKLKVLQPLGDTVIVSDKFPTPFSVAVETTEDIRLNGYLWEFGSDSPVWMGTAINYFNQVQIPKAGKYLFQAMSEDERFATTPIHVEVRLKEKEGTIIPQNWDTGKRTFILK